VELRARDGGGFGRRGRGAGFMARRLRVLVGASAGCYFPPLGLTWRPYGRQRYGFRAGRDRGGLPRPPTTCHTNAVQLVRWHAQGVSTGTTGRLHPHPVRAPPW